jgi:6-phosphogluconate dehydrogenase
MTVGLIGLDNIGISLVQNLLLHKITVVAFDGESANRKRSAAMGIVTTSSIQAVVLHLPSPRIIWNMVATESAKESLLVQLSKLLSPGDIVIDGSRTHKINLLLHYRAMKEKNVLMLYSKSIMSINNSVAWINGDKDAFRICKPMFDALFPEGNYQYVGDIVE